MKKIACLLLAVFVFCGLFAGCGQQGEDGGQSSADRPFRIAIDVSDTSGFYPYKTQYVQADGIIQSLIYDPLIREASDGSISYCLADSYTYNEDDTELIFTLKQGVKFHNGDELTSEDVVFSYEHFCDEYYTGGLKGVKSARADGDYTVVFELEYPYVGTIPGEIQNLFIISKDYYEEVGADVYDEQPVGTGPYSFVSWEKNAQINLTAFDDYYKGTPSIAAVELIFIPDESARMNAIEVGDVDYAKLGSTAINIFSGSEDVNIVTSDTTTAPGILMNESVPAFSDVRVRQAIAYAIDREQMVAAVFPDGGASPSSVWVPKSIIGYSEDVPTYDYDLERAKELMAEAGYADGFDAGTIICSAQNVNNMSAQVVQEQLSQIGITVEIQQLETGTFYEQLFKRDFTLAFISFGIEGTHLADGAGLFVTNGELNWSGYSNPELDTLFDELYRETDLEKSQELCQQIGVILQEDVPWIRCYDSENIVAVTSDVEGFSPVRLGIDIFSMSWKQ